MKKKLFTAPSSQVVVTDSEIPQCEKIPTLNPSKQRFLGSPFTCSFPAFLGTAATLPSPVPMEIIPDRHITSFRRSCDYDSPKCPPAKLGIGALSQDHEEWHNIIGLYSCQCFNCKMLQISVLYCSYISLF